ncbi:MAG: Ig-like domain-containing protein [Pirellulaceae bacterium]
MMIDATTPSNGTYSAGTHLPDGAGGFVQTGTVTITVAGNAVTSVVYQPADDYNEFNPLAAGNALSQDQFVFTVADDGKTTLANGTLASPQPAPETVQATMTIQVRPQNDLPTATSDFIDGTDVRYPTLPQEDVPFTILRTDLLANDFAGQSPTDDESLATTPPVNSNDAAVQLVTAQGATTTTTIGAINSGIAVADGAIGTGFIMYSAQSVFSRFAAAPPINLPGSTNSDQLVAVRFNGTNWEYNNDTSWVVFTPDLTDRLIASVDFSFDTITSLRYATGTVNGIEQGFVSSDLTFTANRYNGLDDTGEFTVSGTGFETSADPEFPQGFRAYPLTTAQGGTVSLDPATGNLIYLSAPDYYGPDSFEYFIADQGTNVDVNGNVTTQVKYDSATVVLNVAPSNDTPLGTNKLFVTLEDTAITITSDELVAGSVGHANPALPAPWDESVQDAPNTNVVELVIGTTTVTASNYQSLTYPIPTSTDPADPRGFVTAINFVNGVFDELIYQPAPNFNMDNPRTGGARTFDAFDFFIGDDGSVVLPLGGPATTAPAKADTSARAFIVVTPQNDAPSLQDDFIETGNAIWSAFSNDNPTEDQSLVIPASFLFNNDANAPAGALDELNLINDSATLALNPIAFTTTLGGSVQLLGSGDLRYTPPANAYGIDTFEYEAIDQGINEDLTGVRTLSSQPARATVTIILDTVNDRPKASDLSLAGTEDNSISFTANDLLQSALQSDAVPLPVSPFDESGQTLRVVAFATGSESIDAGRPQDHPELDANGTGTISVSSGSFGGEFEFNFVNGAFTAGTYTPGVDYNRRTPFSSVEQFSYIIEDDDNGSTPVPGSTFGSTDLPSLRSEAAIVSFSVSPTNDPVTFDGEKLVVDVSEIDTNVPAFISPWAVNVYPGNPSSLDEDQRERVVFTYIPPATPSGLFRLNPEITVNAQSRQATLTIHPAPDQVGTEVIVMRVEDADSQTPGFVPDTQFVTITVNVRPVNDPPSVDLTNLVLSDDDGNTPADAAYDIAADGSIVLTLKEDNTSTNGSVAPYVIPLNQSTGGAGYAPIGLLDVFTVGPNNEADTTEGGLQSLSLDSFPAQTALGGSLTAVNNASGQLIGLEYTPPADYNQAIGASDSFTYIVSDSSVAGETFNLFNSQLESNPRTASNRVRLVLRPVNDAPVFELSTNEVHSAEIQTANSSNIQSFAGLAFNISAGPATATDESAFTNGQGKTFALTPNDFTAPVSSLFLVEPSIDANTGVLTYQPAPTVFGKFTFDVVLSDTGINNPARGDINTSLAQQLTIDIRPVNNPPTIKPAAIGSLEFSTREGQTLLIQADGSTIAGDLLGAIDVGPANEAADIAPLPGGNQTVTLGNVPATTDQGGTLTPITDGNGILTHYEYSPLLGFVGQDTFSYQVVDNGQTVLAGSGEVVDQPRTSTFEATITVSSVNDAPVLTGGNNVVLEEDAGSVTIIDWATNVLPGPLTAIDELATQQFDSISIVKISGDDSFLTGLPVATPNGTSLTLNVDVIDNLSGSATYELILVDTGPNDPANNDVNTTRHQFQIVVGVTNDPPTFDIPAQPIVQVAEGNVQRSQVWATNISPGPEPEPQTQTVTSFVLTVPADKVALFDVLPAINPVTGVLTFTPAQYANGVIEVDVVAVDSFAAQSSQPPGSPTTLTIVIDPVNDVPVPNDDTISTDEDTVLQIEASDLLANDTDPDQAFDPTETIVVTSTLAATSQFGATLSFNSAGDIVYDPTTAPTIRALSPTET